MRALLFATVVAAAVAGCKQPSTDEVLSTLIPSKVEQTSEFETAVLSKLNQADQDLLVDYMVRKMMEANDAVNVGAPPGTTVALAIASQKRLIAAVAAAKALQDNGGKAPALPQGDLQEIIHASLVDLGTTPSSLLPQQRLEVSFTNNASKELAGVEGSLTIVDIFGNEIDTIAIRMTKTIPPNLSTLWIGSREVNLLNPAHREVQQLEKGKYSTRFNVRNIVFSDGTQLTAKP